MSSEPENSATDSVPTRDSNGGKLKSGNPGNKGGGRTPEEFKRKMAKLASSKPALAYLDQCVRGEFGPKFAIQAQKYASERGYGRPVQALEVTGADGAPLRTEIVFVDPPAEGDDVG